jgi:hypothetical protein
MLNNDAFSVVAKYLDTYDYNNIRRCNKELNEQSKTVKFSKPYYSQDKNGYGKLLIDTTPPYKVIKLDQPYSALMSWEKTLYVWDRYMCHEYNFDTTSDVQKFIESYYRFLRGYYAKC